MSATQNEVPQGHLTLSFSMKSAGDCTALCEKLPKLVADLYRAADAMGTVHYCRFIELNGTIYFLAEYDGEMDPVLVDFAKHLGPIFDAALAHTSNAPAAPVASNVQAFVKWAKESYIAPFLDYDGYPGVTVQTVRSRAAAAGIEIEPYTGQQLPLLVIMPMKGQLALKAVGLAVGSLTGLLKKGADGIGTVHFAHIVEMPGNLLGFFTIYDGPYSKYAQDFAEHMGLAFDLMFLGTQSPPPSPTSKNEPVFTQWVSEHDLKPLLFYSAYPGLQRQDIITLMAEG